MALSLLNNFVFWLCQRLFLAYQKLSLEQRGQIHTVGRGVSVVFVNVLMFCAGDPVLRDATGALCSVERQRYFHRLHKELEADLAGVAGRHARLQR